MTLNAIVPKPRYDQCVIYSVSPREWGWHNNDPSDEFSPKRRWHGFVAFVKRGLIQMVTCFHKWKTQQILCGA